MYCMKETDHDDHDQQRMEMATVTTNDQWQQHQQPAAINDDDWRLATGHSGIGGRCRCCDHRDHDRPF